MARRRSSKVPQLIGVLVFVAVAAGVYFIAGSTGPAPRPPANETDANGYDDSFGRLAAAVNSAEFSHVLLGWKDLKGTVPRDPERTREQARELAVEVWRKYRDDRTEANWRALQVQYNDDAADPHFRYQTEADVPIGDPIKNVAKSTQIGFARIIETPYGFHVIRREK